MVASAWVLSVALLAGAGAPVATEGSARATPYDVRPVPHAVVTLSTWTLLLMYERLILRELDGGLSCSAPAGERRCDPAELNGFDRIVVGKKSNDLLLVSDVVSGVLFATVAAGTVFTAYRADTNEPTADFLTDAIVIGETTAVAVLLAHVIKAAVRRPRPTAYAEVGSVATVQHQLSFPSGHTVAVAAAAAAWSTTFWLRHPDDPMRWGVIGLSTAMTTAVAWTRTQAGFHFPTDVIAGAILGGGLGVAIPLWLERDVTVTPVVTGEGAAFQVGWSF